MMEIVLSNDWFPKIGGAHTWLYEVYRRWPRPVTVLTAGSDDACVPVADMPAEEGSLTVIRELCAPEDIDLLKWRSLYAFWRATRLLRRIGPASRLRVHALRAFPEGIVGALYRSLHRRSARLITYAHGEEILVARSSRQLTQLARWVYSASDLIIANSKSTQQLVRSLCPDAKVVCIHPGVDVDAFQSSADEVQAFRSSVGWGSSTQIVSTIARMEPRKNHEGVLRAVADLRREGIDVGYVCAGAGGERDRLMSLAHDLAVEPWVRFPGAVSEREKRLIYASSDVYAMPSIKVHEMIEGFGIVFLEAGAAGCAAISGNNGGQPEAVVDGVTGCVVDGTDGSALRAALKRLMGDTALRKRMGLEARRRASEFSWSNVTQKVLTAVDAKASW